MELAYDDAKSVSCGETEVSNVMSDAEAATLHENVSQWYQEISSRRVDLVGDYAGKELFLIEGDSLLLHCFTDPGLDFGGGYQMLHATFLVERFLQGLLQRKCSFHIAFFEENKPLSVPRSTSSFLDDKYLLARAAIIRHLRRNLSRTHPYVQINGFQSVASPDFQNYLMKTGMYFVMCHDGAMANTDRARVGNAEGDSLTRETQRDSRLATQNTVARRVIISRFLQNGYNVALINGLKWHDTKIMTVVLESAGREIPSFARDPPINHQTSHHDVSSLIAQEIPVIQEHLSTNSTLTERELLSVLIIRAIFPNGERVSTTNLKTIVSFLHHCALLKHLPLSHRSTDTTSSTKETIEFLQKTIKIATEILSCETWSAVASEACESCDVGDLIDGRILNACCVVSTDESLALPSGSSVTETWSLLFKLAVPNSSRALPAKDSSVSDVPERVANEHAPVEVATRAVLPFSNGVFDSHMDSIRLSVDATFSVEPSNDTSRIFRELSHWHNAKRSLGASKVKHTPQAKYQEDRARKRNQWYMAEMQNYSASLTNSIGGSLKRESIQVGTTNTEVPLKPAPKLHTRNELSADKSAASKKPGTPQKKDKNADKRAREEKLIAERIRKADKDEERAINAWHNLSKVYDALKDPRMQYTNAKDFINGIEERKRAVVEAEVQLYMLNALLRMWIGFCRTDKKADGYPIAALAFNTIRSIHNIPLISQDVSKSVIATIKALGFPTVSSAHTTFERALPFEFALTQSQGLDLIVHPSPLVFQLDYCGPYMDRNIGDTADDRVPFRPDEWQRKVLDEIDAGHSLLVVAPTSAGKTFISFYAMKQILKVDNEGVLVYVAPTKALVNQIAAEIDARFSKVFPHGGKSVWAIHTRDHRVNSPTGCQVLVTVPHVLQIMLLAPSNAENGKSWSNRVRRIIFDEVHSIGQADDGLVWEQLLLLAPCPIIALSATVGNPEAFNDWLVSTQKSLGHEMTMIRHEYRYSDLRKYIYNAPEEFHFEGLQDNSKAFARLGLDETQDFAFLHPVASLVNKSRGIPDDLQLEARDCDILWQSMKRHQLQGDKRWDVPDRIDPERQLPSVVRKIDVIGWERQLKEVLRDWMADNSSPFDKVLEDLGKPLNLTASLRSTELTRTTLPLLNSLHEQDALPALLFNYNRSECENVAKAILAQVKTAEDEFKAANPNVWKRKLEEKEKWEKAEVLRASKKTAKKPIKGKKGNDEDSELMSKSELQRDAGDIDRNSIANFDPNAPLDRYSFANMKKLTKEELKETQVMLRKRGIDAWLMDALERGIGVHHAGMNRGYRQAVEMLFRKGFLRVVIATGTLALGINMPTRTVVFSGDSVFLTALNYRQAAGRAGRRGFDLLGNVVFQGIATDKICRLVSSRLPDLNGHFPITTTLVLRLFALLHESKNSRFAVRAINSLLSQPRLYMGSSERKAEVLHHLRFSIEYLRRQYLLDHKGTPLNFAGCITHLYYTENSSFAFHALLKGGYFHDLCKDIRERPFSTVETLMLVMAHIFGRRECRQADAEFVEQVVKRSSSLVFLPKLPELAANMLRKHNQETLNVFSTYVRTYVDQHVKGPETCLPLTGLTIGGNMETREADFLPLLAPTKVRSAFVALSGHDDSFKSISDLCSTTRDGVFLEEAVIPHVEIYPEDTETPLNAYLYDFFRNGDTHALDVANRIRRADVWFVLNDFSLVLATIITSFQNFMKLTNNSEMDMLELKGAYDVGEDIKDDEVFDADEAGPEKKVSAAGSGASQTSAGVISSSSPSASAKKAKAKKVADSWDDDASPNEEAPMEIPQTGSSTPSMGSGVDLNPPAWAEAEGDGKGLLLVLEAFIRLKREFDVKFRAMWA